MPSTTSWNSRSPNRAEHTVHIAGDLDEEPVVRAELSEGLQAPEEPGLDDVRAAVLRAEHVAVAALVAEVGEVRDLVLLVEDDRFARARLEA